MITAYIYSGIDGSDEVYNKYDLPNDYKSFRQGIKEIKIFDSDCYIMCKNDNPKFVFTADMKDSEKAIFLAERIIYLSEKQLNILEFVINKGYKTIGIDEVINISYNLNHYVRCNAFCDKELGEYIVRYDKLNIDENLKEYLDTEQLGKNARLQEGGCYIDGSYVGIAPNKFRNYTNDDELPSVISDVECVLAVQLVPHNNLDSNGIWLKLPYFSYSLELVLEKLDTTLEGCYIKNISSSISVLDNKEMEISQLNILNKIGNELNSDDIEKYEALIEISLMDDENAELGEYLNIIHNAKCYEFCPDIHSDKNYGIYLIDLDGLLDERMEKYFDFAAYGESVRNEQGGKYTDFGYLHKLKDIQYEQVYLSPDNQENIMEQRL